MSSDRISAHVDGVPQNQPSFGPAPSPASEHAPHRAKPFRRRDALHAHSLHFGPNMAPMVDVVLVILIFFMASAAFMGSEWFLQAAMPVPPGSRSTSVTPDPLALPPSPVVLEVGEDGRTVVSFLDLQRASMEQFFSRVAAMPRDEAAHLQFVIRPAANVPYNDVIRANEALEAQGITKVGIGVSIPPVEGD